MCSKEILPSTEGVAVEKQELRDILLINSRIESPLCRQISKKIESIQHKSSGCSVFLTTYGGDPDEAFKIGRCLQTHYEDIRLVVASYCKSAGTLIAVAANELIMGDHGELGPLDIQVRRGEDSPARNSGLDFNAALSVVQNHVQKAYIDMLTEMLNKGASVNQATKAATQLASSIAPALYSQIDPIRIANMRRLISVALEYGGRLTAKSDAISLEKLTELITSYPSHGFVIDRQEATILFNKVSNLCDYKQELDFFNNNRDKIVNPQTESMLIEVQSSKLEDYKNDDSNNENSKPLQGESTKE